MELERFGGEVWRRGMECWRSCRHGSRELRRLCRHGSTEMRSSGRRTGMELRKSGDLEVVYVW